jgi:hypothetical protein
VRLPVDGTYYVQITGGTAGAYRLELTITDLPLTEPTQPENTAPTTTPVSIRDDSRLRENVLIQGEVAPGGLFDRHFIQADAGDILTVQAWSANGSALRLALEIYTPVGELMTRATADTTGAIIPGIGVIETGTYAVFVTDLGDDGGAYTLIWRYESRAQTPTPMPQIILSANDPLPAQTYLYYPFQGIGGSRIRIRIEAQNDNLDPVAALLDQNGTVIAEGDDSNGTLNPLFEATIPSDGTYVLRVNAYGETSGNARITVEALP